MLAFFDSPRSDLTRSRGNAGAVEKDDSDIFRLARKLEASRAREVSRASKKAVVPFNPALQPVVK